MQRKSNKHKNESENISQDKINQNFRLKVELKNKNFGDITSLGSNQKYLSHVHHQFWTFPLQNLQVPFFES